VCVYVSCEGGQEARGGEGGKEGARVYCVTSANTCTRYEVLQQADLRFDFELAQLAVCLLRIFGNEQMCHGREGASAEVRQGGRERGKERGRWREVDSVNLSYQNSRTRVHIWPRV
jgi:hypothetical protein